MNAQPVFIAFGLTLFAGLSTGIGSALAFFARRTSMKFLSVSLGFSAGVMLYVSFVGIFFKAQETLVIELGKTSGGLVTVCAFLAGIIFIGIIDKLVPEFENPHEMHRPEEMDDLKARDHQRQLFKMGIFSAIAIAIHNFPEGLATFTAALKDPAIGVPIALAIAIHNIPEGIAVSIPVYYATGNRYKAFYYSFVSGLAEPLGALAGFAVLFPFLNNLVFGIIFAMVAGIMVYISLDELLPAARKYGEAHLVIYGVTVGMAVMGFSLLFLS